MRWLKRVSDPISFSGGNPTPTAPAATKMLYTGEQFDTAAQSYYLRARYYDPMNGRFTQTDPYSGNLQDPQSLHKYLYCHNNPINRIDPGGMLDFTAMGQAIVSGIQAIINAMINVVTSSFMWFVAHKVLLTAISYYAMWTFLASSIWVGLENQGYVPEITFYENWTVAKAIQVVSGVLFFLGFMIINTIPDLDIDYIAKNVQTRCYELRQQIGTAHRYGTTMAVGVAEGRDGTPITLIATSENTNGGLYLRPGIALKPNEMMVSGTGHAEKRIVDFCQNQRLNLLSIGATRDVCKEICVPTISPTGADIVTPISEKQLRRRY